MVKSRVTTMGSITPLVRIDSINSDHLFKIPLPRYCGREGVGLHPSVFFGQVPLQEGMVLSGKNVEPRKVTRL